MRWLLLLALAACPSRTPARDPANTAPNEGISIAIYANTESSFAVVDDRRWIEVTNGTIVLDRIDASAALQSLVIEPLGRDAIRVASCARERIDDSAGALANLAESRGSRPKKVVVIHDDDDPSPQRFHLEDGQTSEPAILPHPSVLSPLVRCRVTARAGKHLVRVMQVTTNLTYRTQHDVTITDVEHATFTTRFAITTPSWGARATVTLYEGVPGDQAPPFELAQGTIVLDSSTALLAAAPRELSARLRSVYDGAKLDEEAIKPDDIVWGRESRHQVWVWLELTDHARLPVGPLRAHVEIPSQPVRDLEIAADLREITPDLTRWPLWIDEDLIGSRRRIIDRADGVVITDRLQLTISNLSTQPREVWIEERLRASKRRSMTHSWPTRPTFVKGVARTKLTLPAGKTERMGFTIDYEF